MLIGNRWVENTRLKILNANDIVGAGWITYAGAIATNLSERGFLCGFHCLGLPTAACLMEFQILFDGQPQHQGEIRAYLDPAMARSANNQPFKMCMPPIDIPENTEVTVRGRIANGVAGFVSYIDLYAVVYYVKNWEQALPAVCFPTDAVSPGSV